MYQFLIKTPSAKRVFGACLLSFATLIAPIASLGLVAVSAQRGGGATFEQTKTAKTPTSNLAPPLSFVVNTTDDAPDEVLDGNCDSNSSTDDAECTLRAAIQEANNTPGDDTITFSLPPNSTIILTDLLDDIAGNLTIEGPASRVTVSGDFLYRVFRVHHGNVSISNLTIAEGQASQGGGIYNHLGNLTISNSTLTDNHAVGGTAEGGAIYSDAGTLNIINSTISGNTSTGDGGGLLNCGTSTATLTSVTITDNDADGSGGGIKIESGTVTLQNSIVAGNSASAAPDILGAVNLGGFNLIQSISGATVTETAYPGTNIVGPDPMLDVLANNGGPTQTHRLLEVSPAIDQGKNFAPDPVDQRGRLRPVDLPTIANEPTGDGDGSDIGAYEVQDETPQSGTPSFIVNTADDHDDGSCTDIDCTLREAIIAANADSDTSTITFDIPGPGPHVIQLGDYLDELETDMDIEGPTDESVEVRADGTFGIFTIIYPVVSISNLTISNGGDAFGGGIYNEAELQVDNCKFTGNLAFIGGAIENFEGFLIINNSTFTNNQAIFGGGAIDNDFGSITIINSTFTGNEADFGGALSNAGNSNIENSTFNGNHAFEAGGAIETDAGDMIIINSTISGNSSEGDGGGLVQCDCDEGSSVLTNVTITNNRASFTDPGSGLGGGISNFGSNPMTLYNTIVAGNFLGGDESATPSDIDGLMEPESSYNLIGVGGSGGLVDRSTDPTHGNQVGVVNPGLGPLLDNGGPTLTHALLPGSPAFDAAADMTSLDGPIDDSVTSFAVLNASGIPNCIGFVIQIDNEQMLVKCHAENVLTVTRGFNATTAAAHSSGAGVNPPFDQRGSGFLRRVFTSVDVGAFEVQQGVPHHLAFSVQPSNTIAGATITPAIQVQILDAGNGPTTSTAEVTLTIGTNPGGGTLSGTTTVAAVNGTASFSTLSIDQIGSGYTLLAGSPYLIGATSNPFNIISPASISGSKTVSGVFSPGSTVTYTVVLSNAGPASQLDNPGNEFTDALPSGLTLISSSATSGTVSNNVNTVTWNGVIPAGNSVTITITATINNGTATQTISNQGTINYDADGNGTNEASRVTDDPSVGGASDPTSFTVVSPANVSGTKTKAGGNTPGSTVTYTVVLSNSSSSAQLDNPGNEFIDVLPSGLTLVSASATSGTATANVGTNTVSWNGSIAGNGSVTITITATINNVPDGTIVSNQGTINYDADGNGTNEASRLTDDPAVGGPSDPTTFAVNSKSDLTISKSHSGNFSGGQVGATYTITVSNIGTGITSGQVTVTDVVPVGLTPTGPNGVVNGWTCAINAQTLTCTRSDVLAGGGVSYPAINLTVNVANPAPLNVTNTATVSGGGEVNTNNNTASDPTTINCSANFALNNSSPLMISRFRENGPAGPQDEFVEIYNPTELPHTVASGNCSGGGYGVYASSGNGTTSNTATLVCYIPNGTVIPGAGYYLCTGVTYSLNNLGRNGGVAGATATGDAPIGCGGTCGANIPDDAGLVLINRAEPTLSSPEGFGIVEFGDVVYDKVGFGPYVGFPTPGYPLQASTYCEGGVGGCLKPVGDASTGAACANPSGQFPVFPAPPACYGLAGQYEFLRRQTTFEANQGTVHQDTNNNGNDFILVAPNPATNMGMAVTGVTGVTAVLGAAGPYNRNAPPDMPAVKLTRSPFDGTDQLGPRNLERRYIPDATVADPANNPLGTLTLRFRYTNNSGNSINGIRFEVDNLSTLCGAQSAMPATSTVGTGAARNVGSTPDCGTGALTAILKALNSTAEIMVDSGGTAQFVNGTVMEDLSVGAAPGAGPLSPKGGGIDSTFIINPSSANASVGDGVTGGVGNFSTTIGTTDPTKVIRVQVKFGVVKSGRFILLLVPMAKP